MRHSLLKVIHAVAVAVVVIGAPVQPVFAEAVTLHWAGCGITRKAFMSELAAAYERRTGVTIEVGGGGATKGIRDTAKGVTEAHCFWSSKSVAPSPRHKNSSILRSAKRAGRLSVRRGRCPTETGSIW